MTFVFAPGGSRIDFAGTEPTLVSQRRARANAPEFSAESSTPRIRRGDAPVPDSRTVQPLVKAENLLQAQENRQGSGLPGELTEEEQQRVRELKKADTEVRRHEQAHASVGGQYAGMPHYEYERGPDGRQYAVAGEVSIDASPEEDPEATIQKMDVVIRAALAPVDPSPQDLQVAAKARQEKMKALAEKRAEDAEELSGGSESERAAGAYGQTADLIARTIEAQASLAQALVA